MGGGREREINQSISASIRRKNPTKLRENDQSPFGKENRPTKKGCAKGKQMSQPCINIKCHPKKINKKKRAEGREERRHEMQKVSPSLSPGGAR